MDKELESSEMVEERALEEQQAPRGLDRATLARMPLEALLYWVLRGGRGTEAV